MPYPLKFSRLVTQQVVDNVNDIVDPEEVTEVANHPLRHGAGAVGEHIFYIASVEQVAYASGKHGAVILLVTRLALAVEFYDIVGVTLEEVISILWFRVATVARILDYVDTLVEEDKGIGVGMGVIPSHARLYGKHGCVLVP